MIRPPPRAARRARWRRVAAVVAVQAGLVGVIAATRSAPPATGASGAGAAASDSGAAPDTPPAAVTPAGGAHKELTPTAAAAAGAWVVAENSRPGTSQWRLADTGPGIEGYADRASAVRDEQVTLYVSTTAPTFHVEAYRMGYYQGLRARLVWQSAEVAATPQPLAVIESATNTDEARWHPTLTVTVGGDWTPGDYLLKLVDALGSQRYVPLTVRDDARRDALVVLNAVTTWQAYNAWGGHSLYHGPRADPTTRATVVSFDRPYVGDGAGDFSGNELPLVSLVESLGLDITYWTDVDLHEHPERLLQQRAVVSLGHDEYWSTSMRVGAERARRAGVNLAFLGANAIFRHIRLEPSRLGDDRHEVNYRVARDDPLDRIDHTEVTVNWREPPVSRPESALVGDFYECNPTHADIVVSDASSWVFDGTQLRNGDHLTGAVGAEYDRVTPGAPTPRTVQVLAHSPLRCRSKASWSDVSYYTDAVSAAGVFATGTGSWVCELDGACLVDRRRFADARFARITTNVLTAFSRGPAGLAYPSRPNLAALGIAGVRSDSRDSVLGDGGSGDGATAKPAPSSSTAPPTTLPSPRTPPSPVRRPPRHVS